MSKEIDLTASRECQNKYAIAALACIDTYGELANVEVNSIQVEFGYLMERRDGSIEGIEKVIIETESNETIIYYFEIYGEKIQYKNIDERVYQALINVAKYNHPCLTQKAREKEKLYNRRISNNQKLLKRGIAINENMASFEFDTDDIKDLDFICHKLIGTLICVHLSVAYRDESKDDANAMKAAHQLLDLFHINESYLSPKELAILNGTYTNQDIIDMDWSYEIVAMLLWVVGLLEDSDVTLANTVCDCKKISRIIYSSYNCQHFQERCHMRSFDEICDMQDLFFRYEWACYENKLHDGSLIGDLNFDVVTERRKALEWVLSSVKNWDDIQTRA